MKCPECGSREIVSGYGFAGGPLGAYTICAACGVLLELCPDLDGLDEPTAERIAKSVDEWRAKRKAKGEP